MASEARRSMSISSKGDAGPAHGEPGAQAPARRILVANDQFMRHAMFPVLSMPAPNCRNCHALARRRSSAFLASVLFHGPAMTTTEKTLASEAAALLVPADNKEPSIPIWIVRGAAFAARGAPHGCAAGVGRGRRLQGQRQQAPAHPRRRRHARRRGVRHRRGTRPHGEAGASARPAGGRAAAWPLSSGGRRGGRRAGGRRLGSRRLPLPALQDRRSR